MAKAGFKRNAKAIANILHNDPRAQAAVMEAAERVKAEIEAQRDPAKSHSDEVFLSEYHTDRYVVGVNVPADEQARDGIATRAAGTVGLTPG